MRRDAESTSVSHWHLPVVRAVGDDRARVPPKLVHEVLPVEHAVALKEHREVGERGVPAVVVARARLDA